MITIYRCVLPREVPLIVKICVQGKVVCNQLLICSLVPNMEKLCLQSWKHSGKTKETHYQPSPSTVMLWEWERAVAAVSSPRGLWCPQANMGSPQPLLQLQWQWVWGNFHALSLALSRDNDAYPLHTAYRMLHLSTFVGGFEILNKWGWWSAGD